MSLLTIEQKVQAFQQELDNLTAKVIAKRKEFERLAEKTVEQLDRRIIELRNKAEDMAAENARLETEISEKRSLAASNFEAAKQALDKERVSLVEEYRTKNDAISQREAELEKRLSELDKKDSDARAQENNAREQLAGLLEREAMLNKRILGFEALVKNRQANIDSDSQRLVERERSAAENESRLREKESILDRSIAIEQERTARAEEILKRIDEAEKLLAMAVEHKKANDAKSEELVAMKAKLLADAKSLALREDRVTDREYKLKEREKGAL